MAEKTLGTGKKVLRIGEEKAKAITAANAAVGGLGIVSSYNVCHSLCMSLIAVLSVFGVAVAGMPLAFLLPYQLYFWIFGIAILAVATALYFKMGKCISGKMLVANFGLLFAGFPFAGNFYLIFMILGFAIVVTIIIAYLFERFSDGEK